MKVKEFSTEMAELGSQFEKRIAQLHTELTKLVEPFGFEVHIRSKTGQTVHLRNGQKKKPVAKKKKLAGGFKAYWATIREMTEKEGLTKAEAIATYKTRKKGGAATLLPGLNPVRV